MNLLIGLLIPFFGTTLGAVLVFFMKNKISINKEKMLLSFAAGIMVAASVWSLLIPSIEMVNNGKFSFLPAAIGFSIGILFLSLINIKSTSTENNKLSKMIFAITLHNIPEGMAVGVCFAGAMVDNTGIALSSALILALGIAIQNIPEGAIISLPLKSNGYSKGKSFICGTLSGIVEPIFGLITIMLTGVIVPLLPYFLSFAAGAMIFVVVDELIPDSRENYKFATIFFSIGFLIMMILDVYFG